MRALGLLLFVLGAGCKPTVAAIGEDFYQVQAPERAFVTFDVAGTIYRIEPSGGERESVTARLAKLGKGNEQSFQMSKNGAWMVLETSRFAPCDGWECLALVRGDFTKGTSVMVDGKPVRPKGRPAVNNDASMIVYPSDGGPHEIDLYVIRRRGTTWSEPKLLTKKSKAQFNTMPVLSRDGRRVLFDCGPGPYSQEDTDICEVRTNGRKFSKRVESGKSPDGRVGRFAAKSGDYAPDGSIVFESDWDSEQIWRHTGKTFRRLAKKYSNDNSPCVLPDGRIVSLWLGRAEGKGLHELKVMNADGAKNRVILTDLDVSDTGISCHGPRKTHRKSKTARLD